MSSEFNAASSAAFAVVVNTIVAPIKATADQALSTARAAADAAGAGGSGEGGGNSGGSVGGGGGNSGGETVIITAGRETRTDNQSSSTSGVDEQARIELRKNKILNILF